MSKKILIDTSNANETRIAVTNNGKLDDFEIESNKNLAHSIHQQLFLILSLLYLQLYSIKLHNQHLYRKTQKKKFEYNSEEHIEALKIKLTKGRNKTFKNPKTYPDQAVYEFLKLNKEYSDEIIKNVIQYHYDAMGAENILGHYLEEFINENKGESNWIWCSGSVVDKIDFIEKIDVNGNTSWRALQVKASSNTENSSSKEVRENTNQFIDPETD